MVLRVLIVDDTPHDLRIAETLLTGAGYLVNIASNGAAALEQLDEFSPDIILLDLIMPGMDGIAALRAFKEWNQNVPIILCTAAGQESIVRLAMLTGASGVIIKPYEPDTLLRTVLRVSGEEG